MSLDILNLDLRPVDTERAISALRKYLAVMEVQIQEVRRSERAAIETDRPQNGDDEDLQLFWNQQQALEDLFDRDLCPAMRYSFIVLLHTVLETRLRAFCREVQRERSIPVTLGDLRGSPIDQACTYLGKLAALGVGNLPDWQQLRTIQKVRDCIVHAYGYVAESRNEKDIRQLASQNMNLTIDGDGRLAPTRTFCEECLSCLERLFHSLFVAAEWRS